MDRETAVKSAASRSLLVKLLLGYVEELMKQHTDAIRKAKNVFLVGDEAAWQCRACCVAWRTW